MAANRFIESKEVNLTEFLPNHLRGSEVDTFIQQFQDQLNDLYEGTSFELSASLNATDNLLPPTSASTSGVSIVEKINRLTELHDPDLIDLEYIQYFANYLGYTVDINKDELINQDEIENYLRFVIRNLPNWYKIKSTKNAVKILLYSYGMISDMYYWYTNNYTNDWLTDPLITEFGTIPNDYYQTPHFSVKVDLDATTTDLSNLNTIIKAIDAIRPVNTVFHGFHVWARRIDTIYVGAKTRTTLRITVPLDEVIEEWEDAMGSIPVENGLDTGADIELVF